MVDELKGAPLDTAAIVPTESSSASALGRVTEPDEAADAIVALLAPDTRWLTGQSIDLSGGLPDLASS